MRQKSLPGLLRDVGLVGAVMLVSTAGALFVGAAAQGGSGSGGSGSGGPEIARIVSVENGDTACYMTLEAEDGAATSSLAAFDLCREDLVGARARLTYETVAVSAPSCEGDPNCRDVEQRAIVTAVERLSD